MSNATTAARLLAAKLSVPRFRGRAALFRLAERGDTSALDALEASPHKALKTGNKLGLGLNMNNAADIEADLGAPIPETKLEKLPGHPHTWFVTLVPRMQVLLQSLLEWTGDPADTVRASDLREQVARHAAVRLPGQWGPGGPTPTYIGQVLRQVFPEVSVERKGRARARHYVGIRFRTDSNYSHNQETTA